MSISVPQSQEFSEVLELSLQLLGFDPPLAAASRLLHPYSTEEKTTRLVVRQLYTTRNTQKDSQGHTEKRRARSEIEVTPRNSHKGRAIRPVVNSPSESGS